MVEAMGKTQAVYHVGVEGLKALASLHTVGGTICVEESHQLIVEVITKEFEQGRVDSLLDSIVVGGTQVDQVNEVGPLQELPIQRSSQDHAHGPPK